MDGDAMVALGGEARWVEEEREVETGCPRKRYENYSTARLHSVGDLPGEWRLLPDGLLRRDAPACPGAVR